MTIQQEAAVAQAFVAARREGRALTSYPGERPRDLAAAYRIQDAAIGLTAKPIGGWKVGRINPPLGGVDRLSGPIFADDILCGAAEPAMPGFAQGFMAAEAEFLLRIGKAPDPARRQFTMRETMALIDGIAVGIEIASSPWPAINDEGAAVTVSDFGNNCGLVTGASITPDVLALPVELTINGERAGRAMAGTMIDGPFGAARFLFENLAERGIQAEPGQWISTGAVTGVHPVLPGDTVEARFGGAEIVRCSITAF